jgi:hypothetical protein
MGLIAESEIEALAQALAQQHGFKWQALGAEGEPCSGHSDWRARSRKILEAVHQAMLIQIHKDLGRRRSNVISFAQGRLRQ